MVHEEHADPVPQGAGPTPEGPAPAVSTVFIARGSAADQASLLATIPKIYFPWDLLRPRLQAEGRAGLICEYADLSQWGVSPFSGVSVEELVARNGDVAASGNGGGSDGRIHHIHDEDGNEGHLLWTDQIPGLEGVAKAVGGLAWRHGLIQVNQNYRGNQGVTDYIMSAEIAHMVDFYYMEPGGFIPQIHALMHRGQPPPPGDVWWGGNYWTQGGEGWMSAFGMTYSDFVGPDSRFSHGIGRDQVAEVRRILRAERTDQTNPPPPPPPTGQPRINFYAVNGVRVTTVKVGQKFDIEGEYLTADTVVSMRGMRLQNQGFAIRQGTTPLWTTLAVQAPNTAQSDTLTVQVPGKTPITGPMLTVQADQPPPPPPPGRTLQAVILRWSDGDQILPVTTET